MLTPILKLSGPNRRVWFLTEDGETISHIKKDTKTYKLGGSGESSGATSDSDTWRPIQVDGVDKLTDSTTSINFVAGTNITLSYENGTITVAATDTTYSVAEPSTGGTGGSAGLMSAPDKEKLDSLEGESTVVTNTDTSISLTLAQNTVYECTSDAITSLSIAGVATGFKYATIIFNSPSTATTFSMPETGYYCTGSDCEDGEFTPVESMRYSMAVETEFDRITIYVARAN